MSLSTLSPELILDIVENLSTVSLTRFLRTCQSLYVLLGPELSTRITTEQLASTILLHGIRHHNLPIVRLALSHNAPWHTKNQYGHCCSAVQYACKHRNLESLTALISRFGSTILSDTDSPEGSFCHSPPLDGAIRNNDIPLMTLLLENGVSANMTEITNFLCIQNTPLDVASEHGYAEAAELLIRYGAKVKSASRALSYAVGIENWAVAKVLLRAGVSVSENTHEWTCRFPLDTRSEQEIDAWVSGGMEYFSRSKLRIEARVLKMRRAMEAAADVAAGES